MMHYAEKQSQTNLTELWWEEKSTTIVKVMTEASNSSLAAQIIHFHDASM